MNKKLPKKTSWVSRSEKETRAIGNQFARGLREGMVVALYGDLGAGKTTFVKGVAEGLGLRRGTEVSSPTYVVIHQYQGQSKTIFHLDWYRLKKIVGTDAAMAEECFYSNGITLVEWPERGENLLPKDVLRVRLTLKNPASRLIEVI